MCSPTSSQRLTWCWQHECLRLSFLSSTYGQNPHLLLGWQMGSWPLLGLKATHGVQEALNVRPQFYLMLPWHGYLWLPPRGKGLVVTQTVLTWTLSHSSPSMVKVTPLLNHPHPNQELRAGLHMFPASLAHTGHKLCFPATSTSSMQASGQFPLLQPLLSTPAFFT
jgi:hypothetical protein